MVYYIKEVSMKKKSFLIIIIALIGISLALPADSEARRYGRYGCRGGWGWYGAGALAGGVLLGAAIARPWYYGPSPVYVYSPPAVIYTSPPVYFSNQAYAYPDPAVTSRPDSTLASRPDSRPSSGQWVEVPGQSVNGKWVPPHKVWVSDNP